MVMKLKRGLSCFLTSIILSTCISSSITVKSVDISNIFTYKSFTDADSTQYYALMGLVDNYQTILGGITEITLPETYDNLPCRLNASTFKDNAYFTKVIIPKTYNVLSGFRNCSLLKELIMLNEEQVKFSLSALRDCTSLEKMKIYATNLESTPAASIFTNIPTTAIAYVKNDTVKEQLVNWPGSIVVDPNMSEIPVISADKTNLNNKITEAETFLSGIDKSKYNNVAALETAIAHAKTINENASATQTEVDNEVIALTSALNNVTKIKQASSFTITCDSITYKTEGGLKPQANITSGDGAITYKLFSDEACTTENPNSYNGNLLPIGTYYIKGFMAETDDYYASGSNAVKVQVLAITNVNKTTLNSIYEEANSFFEENQYYKEDYDTTAWNKVYRNGTFSTAESIYKDTDGRFTQSEIDAAAQNLKTSFDTLKNSPADTEEALKELQNVIEQAEKIKAEVDNGEEVYTEKSYENLLNNLQKAKELDKTTSTKRIINNRISALQYAIEHLEVDPGEIIPAGEPFAYVEKGGKEVNVASLIADESMNGSAKIKVTFDCADDVSFNESASIEVKAVAAKMRSYQKFTGNSWTQGATCEIELPLVQEIKTGDQVDISAFTYSWDNAADYVYGITKVEFYDEKGHILKTIIDKDIEKENLAEAISKAEAIDITPYTAESVAELTKAIEAAKALTDEATASELKSAITAIENAIKGLKEPTPTEPATPPTKQEPSNNSQPTKPSIAQTNKSTRSSETVAKDKKAAQKIMKQAKITKLKAKSKAKKKITVSWKKVKKAKGYQVEVSAKKNFKKSVFKKFTAKTKLNIKNKKIKSKKTYYVRVRAYATYKDKNNVTKKVYSKWIKKIRKVKVK